MKRVDFKSAEDKPKGRGVYSPLPDYPGLPSKTGKTGAIVVPKRGKKQPAKAPAKE